MAANRRTAPVKPAVDMELQRDKTTKNTYRYAADTADGFRMVVYVPKAGLDNAESIRLTITPVV